MTLFAQIWQEKKITIPTLFTLARIAMVPFIVHSMVSHAWARACFIFVCACLTDFLDGYLARHTGAQTLLGACLDPLADKLLLLSCFFTLAFIPSPLFTIPIYFFWLTFVKELVLVVGVVMLFSVYGTALEMKPTLLGKLTTVAQMVFIIWIFFCYFFQWLPIKTYYLMLGTMMVLSIATLIQYAQVGLRLLKTNKLM